jgi:hypothetical protein
MSELSVLAYAEDLSELSPEQLDAACIEARRTSEFMPVSATIRNCPSKIRSAEPVYSGPPLLEYPDITAEEREAALVYSARLKKILSPPESKPQAESKPQRKTFTVRPSMLPIEQQKAELRKRGYLQ